MEQQPTPSSQPEATKPEGQEGYGHTCTVTKNPDGTFSIGTPQDPMAQRAKTIDEALNMVREKLTGDDGGMSVEQAFRGGFNGSGVPGDGGMGY